MNGTKQAVYKIVDFIKSDRRGLLLTGTMEHEKHLLIISALHRYYKGKRILVRGNTLNQLHLSFELKKHKMSGLPFPIGNNVYIFDTFNPVAQKTTKGKEYDFAILFLNTMSLSNGIRDVNRNKDVIKELLKNRNIGKLFLVMNFGFEVTALSEFYSDHVIYDIEEQDAKAHNSILNGWQEIYQNG